MKMFCPKAYDYNSFRTRFVKLGTVFERKFLWHALTWTHAKNLQAQT